MFERFTTEARAAVEGALAVVAEVGATQVDTGHLLVALTRDSGPAGHVLRAAGISDERLLPDLALPGFSSGLDPVALSSIGIDYEEVRRAVDGEFGAGALERALGRDRTRPSRRRHVPFAPEAKKTLERSLREALALRDRHIGTEHVLLGLVADPSFLAVRLLARHGIDIPTLRRSVIDRREPRAG